MTRSGSRKGGFEVTPALEAYLKAKQADPDAELTEGAKAALDRLTDEDLAGFAKQVKVRVGEPVGLTEGQNAAFRASGGDLPTVTRAGDKDVGYRPPAGRYSGPGGGQSAAQGAGSLKNAWDRFEGDFESFKAWALRGDPDHLHTGLQRWAVVTRIGAPLVDRMAQKVSGAFATSEEAEAHAVRLRDEFPWFDVDVVSMYHFVPYPTDEETRRGVRRVYDDKTLDETMRAHFKEGSDSKGRQMERIREAVERAKDPAQFAEADAARRERGDPEDFPPLGFQPNAVDDSNCGTYDDVRCT